MNILNNFWDRFLRDYPELSQLKDSLPDSWSFGGDAQTADKLLQLVIEGNKTATCSLDSV